MAKKSKTPPPTAPETFGERLARLRKELGLTQAELAAPLGTVQAVISDYERGSLRMHGEMIVRVAEILGVSTDELLGAASADRRQPVPAPRDRRLLKRISAFDRLSKRDREALVRTIDAFLSRAQPDDSAARKAS